MNPLLMTPWWNRAGHSSIPVRLFTEINRNLCAAELCGEEESGWNSAWIPRAGQFSLVARSSSHGGMIAREREKERGEGLGSHCQNPRPRYRSTHRHTLQEWEGKNGDRKGEREKSYPPHYVHCVTTNLCPPSTLLQSSVSLFSF